MRIRKKHFHWLEDSMSSVSISRQLSVRVNSSRSMVSEPESEESSVTVVMRFSDLSRQVT